AAIGKIMLDQENYLMAIIAFRRYAELAPDNPDAHYNLGVALHNRSRDREAKESLETALRLYRSQNNEEGIKETKKMLEELK
ncbi:MAG: tetratricopeptide repeat protein, partial [Spirulinaceae cyanobacterium]